MKPVFVILLTLVVIGGSAVLYVTGLAHGLRRNLTEHVQKLGFNRQSARLYKQATALLVHLEQSSSDLDALMTGDILSPETSKKVTAWVADYRKETGKL